MLCSGYIYSSPGQQLNSTPHDLLDVSFFVLHFKNEGSARINQFIILYSHELAVPRMVALILLCISAVILI